MSPRLVLASRTAGGGPVLPLAAAVAVEAALGIGRGVVLAEAGEEPRRRAASLLASPSARELEASLRDAGLAASARGHLCHLPVTADPAGLEELPGALSAAGVELAVLCLPARLWRGALEREGLGTVAGLLAVELPADRSLAALAAADLRQLGLRARVVPRPLPPLAARRALAGIRPGGASETRARRLARGLLGRIGGAGSEHGQALPAVLGAGAVIVFSALLLSTIGAAVTGKGRVQRAADLAALSAARSMRDDVPRLSAPPVLPDGTANPRHLTRSEYLERARLEALDAGRRNRVAPGRVRVSFPDATAFPPLTVRVSVRAEIDPGGLPGGERLSERARAPIPVEAFAVAEASLPVSSWSGLPATASGGGYSGPLVYRNGEGMRPDVAQAYDRMAAAARRAGHLLVVNSGFRSDAEQAALFAANPDPTWVAPPGQSLHRCATELDLGPASAYGWLAAKARRFGFAQRYSWEAWHYGFVAGPPPCSDAGDRVGGGDGRGGARGLPSFVPARYRPMIERSVARWNVSGALLAAQIMAESAFDPDAVSPAGALGIAQFIPSTAAAYGLRNPFNPAAAIDAQAHLMSDLLRRFRSIPLALAAYNAGPGAVEACGCADPYAETAAYVARILALLDGAGALLAPPLEVRLVK